MSTSRLTFLYPHLFRTARLGEPVGNAARRTGAHKRPSTSPVPVYAALASSTPPKQATFKRHGKAVEPQQHLKQATPPKEESSAGAPKSETAAETPPPPPPPPPSPEHKPEDEPTVPPEQQQQAKEPPPPLPELEASPAKEETPANPEPETGGNPAVIELGPPSVVAENKDGSGGGGGGTTKHKSGPMEAILSREPLEAMRKPPPHLTASPYVHHFDSYSLVKQLETGGYSKDQSITAMKAIRLLLAQNLDVAQAGLVSKSNVENETYLFKAACSELSSELKNNRRLADEQLRQQRTVLQHEVDNLGQSLNQEVLTLNDAVRGMFNDRKMAVREEQKVTESAIQQLNYKIIIMLNSDAKSEIERIRGVLIRRAILGIIFLAVCTLGTLQYASYLSHERKKEEERLKHEAEAPHSIGDQRIDNSPAADVAEVLSAN